MIQKSKVKKYINAKGLSLSSQSYESLDRLLSEVLDQVCLNTLEDSMKTVMPQHCVTKTKTVVEKAPRDGVNLRPEFYKLARNIQDFCAEQAVIMSRQVKG